jgi:hypothetical protein
MGCLTDCLCRVRLPDHNQITTLAKSGVNCVHQYLMKSAAPEKERKFQALKAKHKTVFAFHGSRMECWHAIVRAGLKNVSGKSHRWGLDLRDLGLRSLDLWTYTGMLRAQERSVANLRVSGAFLTGSCCGC